jgi:hypothetical protein
MLRGGRPAPAQWKPVAFIREETARTPASLRWLEFGSYKSALISLSLGS